MSRWLDSPIPRALAILGGGLLAAGLLYVTICQAQQALDGKSRPKVSMEGAPGTLAVLPDRRRIDFVCTGQGSPTVLFESGYGAGATAWGRVQPRIAAKTRVCAYDRAGFGYSDPGPMPRDGAAIARDLDFGLKAAKIAGPYVVVGHSAGGLYARLFAARRLHDVVGLVFVDSSVEHQTQRLEAMFGQGAGSLDGQQRRAMRCLKATSEARSQENDATLLECAPLGGDPHTRQVQLRPETYSTQISELDNLFTTTSDEVDRTGDLLQEIPAIVLTAAKGDGAAGVATDPGGAAWQKFHHQLAGRFLHGDQRLVKSGHLMMFDRPEVVAGAALELVEGARQR